MKYLHSSSHELSVVVCARNEAAHVEQVLLSLRRVFPEAEIIVVDNGSSDGTASTAARVPGIIVVDERTPGKGAAMRAGARVATRAWLLFHDADLEYEVEDSLDVVAHAALYDACCVGVRLVPYDSILVSSWLANKVIQLLLKYKTGKHVPDVLSGTRCLRTQVFRGLGTTSVKFGIETEITRGLIKNGVTLLTRPVRFYPRTTQQGKKIRPWHLFGLVLQALKS